MSLKCFFLSQLNKTLKKYSFICYAFSITKNQYQLVLQSDQSSISDAMQQFNSIIAKKVNKVLQRDGTVFATRFKSLIVENDLVRSLIHTIHLDPVLQGECDFGELDNYQWSSHSYFTGNIKSEFWDPEAALKMFFAGSKENYSTFMKNNNRDSGFESVLKDVNNGKQGFAKPEMWIVGKPDFVKHVIEIDKNRRLRIARHITENVSLEKIHAEVVNVLILDDNDLYRAGQLNVRSTARELFVFLSKKRYDYTGAQAARHLKVTDSAVSKMITRFNNVENNLFLIKSVVDEIC